MKTLISNGQNLGNVNIRRGIFQGDSLSPLQFVLCLIQLSVIFRKTKGKYQLGKEGESINHLLFMDDLKLYGNDERQIDSLINTVRMESGLKKCGVVVRKRGKVVKYDGVDLPDGRRMTSVGEDGYKYLGILECNVCTSRGVKGGVDLRMSRIVSDSKRQDWQTMSTPLRVPLWLQSRRKGYRSKKRH